MIRKLMLCATALALSACTYPETVLANSAAEHEAASGPALWQVSDEDTTIYLFGTIHVLPEGEAWFHGKVESAFDASEEVVFELSLDDMSGSQAVVANLAMLPEGGNLRSLMAEDDRAQYEVAMEGLGLPVAALDPVEPWAAALNLGLLPLLQSGWNPAEGVEMQLRSRSEDKTRGALETIEEQLAVFDTMSMELQLQYLDATVEGIPEIVPSLELLKAEWLEGDADAIGEMLNAELTEPEIRERLLVGRNRNWAGWIENRLEQPGTVFIAVGAGHLAGDGSVQELLAERGLVAERIED